MNECTFCGREDDCNMKVVEGYEILETCTDCEIEIKVGSEKADEIP